jgi:hypothetical protein
MRAHGRPKTSPLCVQAYAKVRSECADVCRDEEKRGQDLVMALHPDEVYANVRHCRPHFVRILRHTSDPEERIPSDMVQGTRMRRSCTRQVNRCSHLPEAPGPTRHRTARPQEDQRPDALKSRTNYWP